MNQSDLSQSHNSDDQTAEEITEHPSDNNDRVESDQDTNMNSVTNDSAVDKMSVFKKKEKTSLFQRTIDRLSFKSRKKRDKDKTFTVEVLPSSANVGQEKTRDITPVEHEIRTLEESPKISPRFTAPPVTVTPPRPSPPTSLSPAPITSTPASTRYQQSRPINQLDNALRKFKLDTAKSRENLSISRPDLTEAITSFTSKPNTPRIELKSISNRNLRQTPTSAPPPAASSRWRQVAPSSNKYVESEWAKLSASMMNLSRGQSKTDLSGSWRETELTGSSWHETDLSSSNMSLDLRGLEPDMERGRMKDRAMSVNVLTAVDNKEHESRQTKVKTILLY